MSARRKKSDGVADGEHHVDERWMASYMDMVTVLMCMFIVLFAMSTTDAHKFQELKNSLATGFGQVTSQKVDTAKGIIVPKDLVNKAAQPSNLRLAVLEYDKLKALEDAIDASLTAQGLQSTVAYTIDARGLTVRLVGANTFFASNSTALTSTAGTVLATISGPLNTVTDQISIEGHADVRPPDGPFPTNWELSSGRAVQVLRYLVERGGIKDTRVGAVGYGSARPLTTDTSPSGYAQNRRVDVVVLSNQPEAVRALIPQLVRTNGAVPQS
ncbi:MAG: hypothetical protein EPN48_10245 [Microbacteriaceae bacterium]|nr:MAG: hypothetical protein EPN48_10245 [Microbacteriaceae bacterium]